MTAQVSDSTHRIIVGVDGSPGSRTALQWAMDQAGLIGGTVAEVSAQISHPVSVLAQVVEGHPVETSLHAAAGADLLVVGSRGHGSFAGIVLGSISQHCVQHAPCPVVVVP